MSHIIFSRYFILVYRAPQLTHVRSFLVRPLPRAQLLVTMRALLQRVPPLGMAPLGMAPLKMAPLDKAPRRFCLLLIQHQALGYQQVSNLALPFSFPG